MLKIKPKRSYYNLIGHYKLCFEILNLQMFYLEEEPPIANNSATTAAAPTINTKT